jgi:hypothetical protein
MPARALTSRYLTSNDFALTLRVSTRPSGLPWHDVQYLKNTLSSNDWRSALQRQRPLSLAQSEDLTFVEPRC